MKDYPLNALGLSHQFIESFVKEGDFCIDGTAGRGRDTAFLCGLVGDRGRVLAFDIQSDAVSSTQKLLAEKGFCNATVLLENHSRLDAYCTPDSVSAIMFNFGWLPGGDHHVFSHGETSVTAIQKGLRALKPGGVMSICIYYGKETGYEERDTLLAYLKTINPKHYTVLLSDFVNRTGEPPLAAFILKDRL